MRGGYVQHVRKIKATQKIDARGACMLCMHCERGFERLAEIAASYTRGRIQTRNGRFSLRETTKKERKKTHRRGPKRHNTKQKSHKHPKRHCEGTCRATTASSDDWIDKVAASSAGADQAEPLLLFSRRALPAPGRWGGGGGQSPLPPAARVACMGHSRRLRERALARGLILAFLRGGVHAEGPLTKKSGALHTEQMSPRP